MLPANLKPAPSTIEQLEQLSMPADKYAAK